MRVIEVGLKEDESALLIALGVSRKMTEDQVMRSALRWMLVRVGLIAEEYLERADYDLVGITEYPTWVYMCTSR